MKAPTLEEIQLKIGGHRNPSDGVCPGERP